MMKWTKPSAETIAYFERIAPGPPIEARRMFGMPARFLNGHMLVSVFGDAFMLHLSAADRLECIAAGARPFAPMGRSAKEYVEITPGHFDDHTLKVWIARGMRYLGSLPPKLPVKTTRAETERGVGAARAETKRRAATPRAETKRRAATGARRAETGAKGPASKRGAALEAPPSKRGTARGAAVSKPRVRKARAVKAAGAAGRGAAKAATRKAPARKSAAPAKAKRAASKKARGKRS